MSNRLFRKEAAAYIGCGLSKLIQMERSGVMKGTYYTVGNRSLYIVSKLDEWMAKGGEHGADERNFTKAI